MTPSRLFYGFDAETVFDPQTPKMGESLLSWIARTTIENELPNITTIMRDVGQVHRNRVVDVMRKSIDVEGLATILGNDLHTVQALRSHDLGEHRVRYLGASLRTADVHTRERRFSPATLAADAEPFYRAAWLVRTFPVCTESWQALRTDCSCGTAQTWATVSSPTLCEACGEDLRDVPGEFVSKELQPGLQFLADILFGDDEARGAALARLPPFPRSLDPGEIMDLALLMARVVDPTMPDPRRRMWRDDPMRLARALAVAAPLLKRWPETPWLALEAAGDVRRMLPRCTPLKRLMFVLAGDHSAFLPLPIRTELDRIREDVTLDGDSPDANLIDLNDAERIMRVNKWKIRAARAGGHLTIRFVIRRGEILPGYERGEIEAFAKAVDWPSSTVAAKRLGVPPYAVEQICAMGDLPWAKAPYRTLRPGLRLPPDSVERLSAELRAASIDLAELHDPVPLTAVMRGIGGREKPWGPVLRGFTQSRWPFAMVGVGRSVREIYVSARDAASIRDLRFDADDWPDFPFSGTVLATDACDILNVSLKNSAFLAPYKAGEHRGGWTFKRDVLLTLAAEVITSSELVARHFIEPKTGSAAIRRAGLLPLRFGFRREGAEARFDAALRR